MEETADPGQGPPVAEFKQHANVSALERNRSGSSRSDLLKDPYQGRGSSKFRDYEEVHPRHKLAALENLTIDRSAAAKDARKKGNRDLSGIRREDVERKREEIGKERPRMRDENERRKEALALLRFKLEAHVKRTEKRCVTDGKRDVDYGEDWGPKLLRKLADDTDNIKVRAPAEREESIVVVSGSPRSRDAAAPLLRQTPDRDAAPACIRDQHSGAQWSRGEPDGPSAPAAEDTNVTVKDIYMVESVRPSNRPLQQPQAQAPSLDKGPGPSNGCDPTTQPTVHGSSAASMTRDRSAHHLKLAEKVAKLMEDLDAPTDLGNIGPPRLKLRIMEDSETGPIVLMKCSSRDHARVVCETLSAKLGPEETIETKTSQGTRRQQHHFHFQGSNLLASFLKKAFSSRPRSKSRPPKDGAHLGSTAGNTASFDSGVFDSSLFNSSNLFDSTVKDYVAATWGQTVAKDANPQPARAPTQEGGSAQPQHFSQGLHHVQERFQDDGGVCASAGRKVRSANASPAPGGRLVNDSPARQPVTGYMARLLATPARSLGRAKSIGRNRQGKTEDESGAARGKGRLFGFGSPGKKRPQNLFEDRLGPVGNQAADIKSGKLRSQGRFFSFSSPTRRKNKKSTGFHAGADSPLHQDRESWSGILGSPVGERGRGFGGTASSCEQRWGFLGGLGSPVRDNRKCGNGWGPVYSLTDVANDSGDEDIEVNREEPTSPEVTCIGRVKARAAPRCPLPKAATGKEFDQTWSSAQSVDRRKHEPKGTLPHSGPVLSQAPKLSDAQPKQSRWKSILGLYRGRAKGDPTCGNMEKDICLSRCRKTSISRFGCPAPAQDARLVDAHIMPLPQTECESCGNPKPCECATCTDGHVSFVNRQARDSIQAWLAAALEGDDLETTEPWTDSLDQASKLEQGCPQSVEPVVDAPPQQCLWQRRQFSKPRPLDVGSTVQA